MECTFTDYHNYMRLLNTYVLYSALILKNSHEDGKYSYRLE